MKRLLQKELHGHQNVTNAAPFNSGLRSSLKVPGASTLSLAQVSMLPPNEILQRHKHRVVSEETM